MKNYPFKVKKKGRRMWRVLRHRAPKLLKGLILFFIFGLFLSIFGGIGYLMYRSPLFQVKEVRIHGCSRVQRDRVVDLVDLKGKNILSLNLRQVARRIKQERWIDHVVVKRVLPDRIEIDLLERQAVALVNLDSIYLVDEKGIIFRDVRDGEYFDLPVFTGLSRGYLQKDLKKSSQLIKQAIALLFLVDEKIGLSRDKVSEIHIDPDIGFSLFDVENATQIKLGFNDFQEKLERYKRIREVMDRERTPRVIDLRCKDKVFVSLDETKHSVSGNREVKKNG
jgi:cell division protein FtsQ